MKKVVAYCRTAWEAQESPYYCVKSQAKAVRRYAKNNGITLGNIYMDPAKSGVTLNRSGLKRLLADCRAGKVDTVITKHPDRLARDMMRLISLMKKFQGYGVRVEFSTKHGRGYYESQQIYWSALAELQAKII